MTYSSGGLIQAADYNIFATGDAAGAGNNAVANLNTIWGSGGTLAQGWGQSSPIGAVSAGSLITATQWSTLFSRFTTIANQTGVAVTAVTNPTAGQTITQQANFSANVTSLYNKLNDAAAVGTTITAGGATSYASPWKNSLTATHTITFASAAAARYFFNAGGRITQATSLSGGTGTPKDVAWSALASACGTINLTTGTYTQTIAGGSYTGTTKTGGSGTPTTYLTTTGFYGLTTTPQALFKQFSSTYLYTSNYIQVSMNTNAAAGSATTITVTVLLYDTQIDYPNTSVDATTTSTVTLIQPSTTYLTNTWGTPTISSSITGS